MALTSLYGQSVVGSIIHTDWWADKPGAGGWEVTQGYGPTSVDREPAGHGYKYWHAGVDIGLNCGTLIVLPGELIEATLTAVDNPDGYGTALVVTITGNTPSYHGQSVQAFDIWLGHLAQRLSTGKVRGGDHLAASNNSGNSTGCHVHVEVRPHGGKYGSDVDPSTWLLNPAAAAANIGAPTSSSGTDPITAALEAAMQPVGQAIDDAGQRFVAAFVGASQAALGTTMMLGGVGLIALGARGLSPAQAYRSAAASVRSSSRRAAAGEYQRERQTQGAIAADQREQLGEQRGAARDAAAQRSRTIGAYRAGLISRAEAQRRLGEPVRATGRRPTRAAYGRGFSGPGVYRTKGGGTVDLKEIRRSRVRASRIKGAKVPALPASTAAASSSSSAGLVDDIPF